MNSYKQTHFWQKPAYLQYVQPPLTAEMVAEAEAKIGHRLPAELVALLKIQNGGYLRYRLRDTPHEMLSGIGDHFPSLGGFDWDEVQEYASFDLTGLVPFDGDGHWYMCLDYREERDLPAVSYIDVECEEQEIIAPSFGAYLELLELEANGELVVETAEPINDFARRLEGLLNIAFEGPDYFNQGYAIYRSQYKKSWLWLTPNNVPAGFARESEDRYEELKVQMEGTALRYPELPKNALLLELSEKELYGQLAGRLREAGTKSVPIGAFIP